MQDDTIVITCPKTGKDVSTGMAASKDAFASSDFRQNSFQCPDCHEMHTWDKKDARRAGDRRFT